MPKKPKWVNTKTGTEPSTCEIRLGKMLTLLGISFEHRAKVAGKEVDYLIKYEKTETKKKLIIEADGDIYHMDEEEKKTRDKHLNEAGYHVVHIWCSEIAQFPDRPYANLAKIFKIKNPPSIYEEKKSKKKRERIQVSRSPKKPREKKYRI